MAGQELQNSAARIITRTLRLLVRKEFVEAYVNHAFNTSVESLFQEFKRGFFLVCEQDLVRLFRPEELQGVLVGQDVHDWEKFKQNTSYGWRYHDRHPTIQMFWEVFDELTEEQRKDFLRFLTGYRRALLFLASTRSR
ncbi:E3 ISG15--protein ligase HERC5-like [Maylandia zebra]|uniref:E3 ISG15--protein ligase HERC5-like n=1 Tax=Maylandia zebra TaxID=106582 RepID=UPI000D30E1BC|nr:E3 ISG15--protein ligase HERC5-like [Maylandia zebra]